MRAPVYRSLTSPVLRGGISPLMLGLIVVAAMLLVAFELYRLLPSLVAVYAIGVALCKRDPYGLQVILRNLGSKPYLP